MAVFSRVRVEGKVHSKKNARKKSYFILLRTVR
jgi:hypothetical protein